MEETFVHRFEQAGLGNAPFRLVDVVRKVGPIKMPLDGGAWAEVGSPGQPMGTCAYCGTGIAECCVIESADGRRFEVGNVCVGKTGDAGLKKVVDAKLKELRRSVQTEKDLSRIAAARSLLDENPEISLVLSSRVHPAIPGKTYLDYVNYIMDRGGRSGRVRVSREIEKAAASIGQGEK